MATYPERFESKGEYYFKFIDGSVSENFSLAEDFVDGYALVKKNSDGNWQFMDRNGKLSEEYFEAYPYNCGVALTRKGQTSPYNFIDIYGNKSEDFFSATPCEEGYSHVKREKNGKELYRDVFGRVTEEKTEVGDYAYQYMSGKIKKYQIPRHLFFDEAFRLNILSEEVRRTKAENEINQ